MASWLKGVAQGALDQAKSAARERLQAAVGRGDGSGGGGGETCSTVLSFDFSKSHERITAFGGSMAYYQNWVTNHPNKEAIYRALFTELRPGLLRFRNTFAMHGRAQPVTDEMRADAELYAAAIRMLGYAPPVLLTSWSPPAEFKQSGKTLGGCEGTAIKAGHRGFMYEEIAQWWVDSIKAFRALGVAPRYVSLQNEPDYDTAGHDCCKFDLKEKGGVPGYENLVFATHARMHKQLQHPPGLVGPEHTKIDGFLPTGKLFDKLEVIGNHMYGSGDFESPDSLLPSMRTAGRWAKRNHKELWCTEFGKLKDHETWDPLKLGEIVLNALVHGGVSAYCHWDLFWGAGTGEGSLLLVENPWNPQEWQTAQGFRLTPSFWWFAHFSKFIRPGMTRVDAQTRSRELLVAAFSGPHDAYTVVVINKGAAAVAGVALAGLPPRPATVFQTTLTGSMQNLGAPGDAMLQQLPPHSITTVTTEC